MRTGRSTGHPGLASTTPEMSAVGPDGRAGPDGWAGPVAAGRTPHDAVTRTSPATGSSHRARAPGRRLVVIMEAWTALAGDRFPRGEARGRFPRSYDMQRPGTAGEYVS